MRPPRPRALVPTIVEAAAKLSRTLGRREDTDEAIPEASAPLHLGAGLHVDGPNGNGHLNGHPLPGHRGTTQLGLT